jgi:metallophosphoesterase (TIGR00282 family)
MNILFIGDIFGKPGRLAITENIAYLKEKHHIDFTIANVENASHGRGISQKVYNELEPYFDCMTLGNHFLASGQSDDILNTATKLVRPLNIYPHTKGQGSKVFDKNMKIRVTNLLGKAFISELNPDNPFLAIDRLLRLCNTDEIHIIDFHAETTSEKNALGFYLDGKVSAVLGTHTHVQTSDDKILPNGTAYLSDVGMTGPYDSIIGVEKGIIIQRQLMGIGRAFDVASGPYQLNAVVLTIDEKTRKAKNIKRINITPFKRED